MKGHCSSLYHHQKQDFEKVFSRNPTMFLCASPKQILEYTIAPTGRCSLEVGRLETK